MVYPSKRVALRGLVLLVTAAVLGLGLAIPGQVAAVDHGPVRVTPRTLPPASALAVIRTITSCYTEIADETEELSWPFPS